MKSYVVKIIYIINESYVNYFHLCFKKEHYCDVTNYFGDTDF